MYTTTNLWVYYACSGLYSIFKCGSMHIHLFSVRRSSPISLQHCRIVFAIVYVQIDSMNFVSGKGGHINQDSVDAMSDSACIRTQRPRNLCAYFSAE